MSTKSATPSPLSEDVLRQLMRQVGLSESGTADPAQLLRRIDQLVREESEACASQGDGEDVEDGEVVGDGESNDGYDTVCDEDEADIDEIETIGRPGRNNSGTQNLRQRHHRLLRRQRLLQQLDDALEDQADQDRDKAEEGEDTRNEPDNNAAIRAKATAADGMKGLQLRMDGVVMSVIEGLHGAVQSLLKLHELHSANDKDEQDGDQMECVSLTPLAPPTPLTLSSLNESGNCSRGARGSPDFSARKVRPRPKPKPLTCDARVTYDNAKRLLPAEGDQDQQARKITLRWERRQRQMQRATKPPTADLLARRLENLELLLLAFMEQQVQQRWGGTDGRKLEVMLDLKRSFGGLQAQLFQLQAQELSQGVRGQHRQLDRTWNIRRDWRLVPRAPKRAPDAMLACAVADKSLAPGDKPTRRDRWLLKFLPRGQRQALPELMRTVSTYELVGSSAASLAAASASGLTRARRRPLITCRHLRDQRDDVIRKFVYALQP